jgi:hypothetical protein
MNKAASKALFEEQTQHLESEISKIRGWRILSRTFPILDIVFEKPGRHGLRIQMEAEDWNELPPIIRLLTVEGEWLIPVPAGPPGIFHQGPHPITQKPFVCMAGAREYHTHESHIGDSWENYKTRSGYDLGGILTRIWNGWLKCTP